MESDDPPIAMPSQQYCLRWNNHSFNFISMFDYLFKTEAFTDVTLAVSEGATVKCHKVVLAACSTYFQDLFLKNPCDHPVLILGDVQYHEIKSILEYMYKGEVNVAHEHLHNLLRVATFLKVKGLMDEINKDSLTTIAKAAVTAAAAAAAAAATEADCSPTVTNGTHSSGYISPPNLSIPSNSAYIQYGKSPLDASKHLSLWAAFPGIPMPHPPISGQQPPVRYSSSYDNTAESSPLSRKKQSIMMACRDTPILRNVLGGEGTNTGQETPHGSNSNGSVYDSDRRNSGDMSESLVEEDDMSQSSRRRSSLPNYHPPSNDRSKGRLGKRTKPEWKRYKQYTREHIYQAMEAVKNSQMSALQAARQFKVPSRTLYDKLKKAGILPSSQRRKSSSSQCGSARFPYQGKTNGHVYGNGISNTNAVAAQLSDDEPEPLTNTAGQSIPGFSSDSSSYVYNNTPASGSSHEPEDIVMDMSTRSPSSEDEVEDLSVRSGDRYSKRHQQQAIEDVVTEDTNIPASPPPLQVVVKEEDSDNPDEEGGHV